MSSKHNFPFNIQEIANLLPLVVRRRNSSGMYVDCFYSECNHARKGKMNINFAKDAYNCAYCGQGGGMLKFYADYNNIDIRQARVEIMEALNRTDIPVDYERKNTTPVSVKYEPPTASVIPNMADIKVRHHTYSMMLNLLSLSSNNRSNLISRGLNDEQIQKLGYKSTPVYGFEKLAKRLLDSGCTLEGVPGFYKNANGNWSVNFTARCSGILVPYRDIDGRIQSFQIRLDKTFEDGCKYIWLSSVNLPSGTGSGNTAHFVGNPTDKRIYITEGGMKADIAHMLSGKTFIAIAGTGSIGGLSELFPKLKQCGVEEIAEAFDMDKHINEQVMKNLKKLHMMIDYYGFPMRRTEWEWNNDPLKKGIDDYYFQLLLAKRACAEVQAEHKNL